MPAFIFEYYLTVCKAIVNRRRRSKNGSLDASQAISSLKVSKSRKQILKFSFEPKIKRKYFCIPALAL
jgi:hypothetical protein